MESSGESWPIMEIIRLLIANEVHDLGRRYHPRHLSDVFTIFENAEVRGYVTNWFNDVAPEGSALRARSVNYQFSNHADRSAIGAGIETDNISLSLFENAVCTQAHAHGTSTTARYWTRSPGAGEGTTRDINVNGTADLFVMNLSSIPIRGIRPVLWIYR